MSHGYPERGITAPRVYAKKKPIIIILLAQSQKEKYAAVII